MAGTGIQPWGAHQVRAAYLIAIGWPIDHVAGEVGVHRNAIRKWLLRTAFVQMVDDARAKVVEQFEPAIMANVHLAVDVQRRMLVGEIRPDDKRYLEARRLLERFLDRLLYVEPAPPQVGFPANGISVPIQINTAPGDGAAIISPD